jgi:MFS family permease
MRTVSATPQSANAGAPIRPRPDAQGPRELPRGAAFWTVAAVAAVLLAASSAPSPLYPVLQARFGFSALTLTVIFAVYVLALLLSLLTAGRLSDFVGRRPVLAGALVVEIAAMAVFLSADSVAALLAARFVQGAATGAAIGVLGAYLLDLQPQDGSRLGSLVNSVAPVGGLGIGAIGTGLLVAYAPHPTKLVFAVLLVLFTVFLAATGLLPETVRPAPGAVAALRPRVAVPPTARRAFLAATPTMIATWALGGLILSVGGSLLSQTFAQHSEAVIGLIIGVFAVSGALAALAVSSFQPRPMSVIGTSALVVGDVLFGLSLTTTGLAVFVLAAVITGAGFGAAFLGALRSVTQLAAPNERAGLVAAVYIVSYVAFSVPAVIAGVLITHIGLATTALYYSAFVLLVSVTSLAMSTLSARQSPAPSPEPAEA